MNLAQRKLVPLMAGGIHSYYKLHHIKDVMPKNNKNIFYGTIVGVQLFSTIS